jgi:hypothetical protein
MTDAPAEWRFHIGVHKTATTHAQETLRHIAATAPVGFAFVGPREMKPVLAAAGFTRIERALAARGAPPIAPLAARRARHYADAIEALAGGARRVVVSYEDFIGTTRDALGPTPYANLMRAAPIAKLGRPVKLFLSLRAFDGFLTSVYAENLVWNPDFSGGFAAIRARALAAPPRWTPLVARLRRIAPQATLHVWTMEDYARDPFGVLEFLAGEPLPRIDADAVPRLHSLHRATPSAAAVARAEAVRTRDVAERRREIRAIVAAHPTTEDQPRFAPFSADERARLQDAFRSDLEEIAARGLATLYPGSGGG